MRSVRVVLPAVGRFLVSGLLSLLLLVGAPAPTAVTWSMGSGAASTVRTTSTLTRTSTKATTALARLTVKGKAAKTGYARSEFGAAWADVDRNGCDQRNDMLRRDLRSVTLKAGTHGCVVLKGTLVSAYTNQTISFTRGAKTSSEVQIDHMVALENAWVSGANRWSAAKRKLFANDPLNLEAVDGTSNSQKGSSEASAWLPRNKAYRCTYVARQISVKAKYSLSVTSAEKAAMGRVLKACPGQETYRSTLTVTSGASSSGKPSAAASAAPTASSEKPATRPTATSAKPGSDGSCPAAFPIKGNENSMIYHVPGGRYYARTKAEQCFSTEAAARAAGFRPSKA